MGGLVTHLLGEPRSVGNCWLSAPQAVHIMPTCGDWSMQVSTKAALGLTRDDSEGPALPVALPRPAAGLPPSSMCLLMLLSLLPFADTEAKDSVVLTSALEFSPKEPWVPLAPLDLSEDTSPVRQGTPFGEQLAPVHPQSYSACYTVGDQQMSVE